MVNPVVRILSKEQEEIHKKNFPLLRLVWLRQNPKINAEAIGSLSIEKAAFVAQMILILRTEQEDGKITSAALSKFFQLRDFSVDANCKNAFKNFWTQCGVSEKKSKALVQQLDATLALRALPISSQACSPEDHQVALASIAAVIAQLCRHLEPFWSELGDNFQKEKERTSRTLASTAEARKTIIQEDRNPLGHDFGRESDIKDEKIEDALRKLRLYTHVRIPEIVVYCTHLDANLKSSVHHIALRTIAMRHFNRSIDSHIATLIETWMHVEMFDANITGIIPRIEGGKERLTDFLQSKIALRINLLNDVVRPIKETTNLEQIKALLEYSVEVLGDNRNPTVNLDERLKKSCSDAVEKYRETMRKCFSCYGKSAAFLKRETNAHLSLSKEVLLELKNKVDASWQMSLAREIKTLMSVHASLATDVGLKRFVGAQRKHLEETSFGVFLDDIKHRADRSVEMAAKCGSLKNSVAVLARLFEVLSEVNDQRQAVTGKQADECLKLLELQEALVEQRAEEAAKKVHARRELGVKAAIGAEEVPESVTMVVSTPTIPSAAPVLQFNELHSPAARAMFQWRYSLSRLYGINAFGSALPIELAREEPTRAELAMHQQLYAMSCFAALLEMLFLSQDADEQAFITQIAKLWGYLALEQGMTREALRRDANALLLHDLKFLLQQLNVSVSNRWTERAARTTVVYRYPAYHGTPAQASDFGKELSEWMTDWMALQLAVTRQNCTAVQHPLFEEMEQTAAAFQKQAAAKDRHEVFEQRSGMACQKLSSELNGSLKILNARLVGLTEASQKALANAIHHLRNLNSGLLLLQRFPNQLYLHVHLNNLLVSTQYFTENLGAFISVQRGEGSWVHSLASYSKEYGLGSSLNAELSGVLAAIDVEKGSEYLHRYAAREIRPATQLLVKQLSDLYARTLAALHLGDGAVPAGRAEKSLAELQGAVFSWAERFVKLTSALVKEHATQ